MSNFNETVNREADVFFDSYGTDSIREYFEQLFHGYLIADEEKDGLEMANLYWFITELQSFLKKIEPDKYKKRTLQKVLDNQ